MPLNMNIDTMTKVCTFGCGILIAVASIQRLFKLDEKTVQEYILSIHYM